MLRDTLSEHTLQYDGKESELYKIYALSILLSIFTLGIYHFWGKTRKRRYITSCFILDKDRFEYTGYGSELLVGLILGVILLVSFSLPLMWASEEIKNYNHEIKSEQHKKQQTYLGAEKDNEEPHHFEQHDPFHQNKLVAEFTSITNFWVQFNDQGFFIKYKKNTLDIKWRFSFFFLDSTLDVQFNPAKHIPLLLAIMIMPLYLVFFFIYLPFLVVYGSLRYRVSRLRWRGIRGHLDGSALVYGLLGLMHTFLKVITAGFWIPLSDIMMTRFKLKKLFFGNQKASFDSPYKSLILVNLATIGACLYLVGLMSILGYFILPFIVSLTPHEGWLIEKLIFTLIKEGYYICVFLLLWICYIPRYWYRAAVLRTRYNCLHIGSIGFVCDASGFDYFKLFVINDLIFIFTLTLGLPWIWQRRMRFFCKHVKVTGNLNELQIEQATGKKTKFGGGFASVMNLEIGLI